MASTALTTSAIRLKLHMNVDALSCLSMKEVAPEPEDEFYGEDHGELELAKEPHAADRSFQCIPLPWPTSLGASSFHPKDMKEFTSKYEMREFIARGAFGEVWECVQRRTGKNFAAKVIFKDSLPRMQGSIRCVREFRMHRLLRGHPNVVEAEEMFEDQRSCCIVQEYCPQGDLKDLLDKVLPLDEQEAAALFVQVVAAVRHCHEKEVLHCDLKLENFVVTSSARVGLMRTISKEGFTTKQILGRLVKTDSLTSSSRSSSVTSDLRAELQRAVLKLTDFGSAVLLPHRKTKCGVGGGSLMYQAPEALSGKRYDFKADIWALGVILYALLLGSFPFKAPTEALLPGMIKRGVFDTSGKEWEALSGEARDLITGLLQLKARKRPTIWEAALHPWLHRTSP